MLCSNVIIYLLFLNLKIHTMDATFKKLNYKEGQPLFVIHPPMTFEEMIHTLPDHTSVFYEIKPTDLVDFIMVFTMNKIELNELVKLFVLCLNGDAVVWIAYPKGTSKRYKCDFNRDDCWELMAPWQMMPVRQVAIDDDWSALRFRNVKYIKSKKHML